MTLKEKLEIIKGYDEQDPYLTFMTIADDYAIEFGNWLRYNCVETDYGWQNHGKQYSETEILKLFKEEKGL